MQGPGRQLARCSATLEAVNGATLAGRADLDLGVPAERQWVAGLRDALRQRRRAVEQYAVGDEGERYLAVRYRPADRRADEAHGGSGHRRDPHDHRFARLVRGHRPELLVADFELRRSDFVDRFAHVFDMRLHDRQARLHRGYSAARRTAILLASAEPSAAPRRARSAIILFRLSSPMP